ncbi:hypothetical protein KVR01_012592 [Diaporthe batatas]|uniref:uncharacterized protein n=1 Tax=Diaporthe batatas TaxID=748121 RepID=UPI001D041791|nr:uncharacterized protein KVR01_012592 [Diaporthe batatas]KAG8157550.1 hypothetical protein KVR01_012592 [Diaporthe batatas]
MPATTPTVFVTGATGEIGTKLLSLLQSSNIPTRVLCRRQDQADRFNQQPQVEAVLGDLTQPAAALASHMAGCKTLFLLTPPAPNQLAMETALVDAAIATGTVGFVVKIAASDQRPRTAVPWAQAHYLAEEYMREACGRAGVRWTSLRPSGFMSNLMTAAPAIRKGFLPQTSGDGRAPWVDTADIAAVAHRVILDGPTKHAGRAYVLTGPERLNMSEFAASLSRAIGHRVRYLHLPSRVFRRMVKLGGRVDDFMVDGLVAQFVEIVRAGDDVDVSRDVEEILGRLATSVEQWGARNRERLEGFDVLPYIASGFVVGMAVLGYLVW